MRYFTIFSFLLIALAGCSNDAPVGDVKYQPSSPEVVNAMLDLAGVSSTDTLADLGCGTGSIAIAAAASGARSVCVELDKRLCAEAQRRAEIIRVNERMSFQCRDLFDSDLKGVTVVSLFLYPDVNARVWAMLQKRLPAGTRVVTHWHEIPGVKPVEVRAIRSRGIERNLYLYTVG